MLVKIRGKITQTAMMYCPHEETSAPARTNKVKNTKIANQLLKVKKSKKQEKEQKNMAMQQQMQSQMVMQQQQAAQNAQEEERVALEAQKQNILRQILTEEARQRSRTLGGPRGQRASTTPPGVSRHSE